MSNSISIAWVKLVILFMQICDLTEKLESTSSECLRLEVKNKTLEQELVLMRVMQKKCEKLKKSKKKLEQEVVNLKIYMKKYGGMKSRWTI